MHFGLTLVAALIVAGNSGHQHLHITAFGITEETPRRVAPQLCRDPSMMPDVNLGI